MDFPASVFVHLTPYIEMNTLYTDFLAARGQGRVGNVAIPTYLSPIDPSIDPITTAEGLTSFAANLRVFSDKGLDTPWHSNMPLLRRFTTCTTKATSTPVPILSLANCIIDV